MRDGTWPVLTAGALGALLAAASAWWFVGWVARRSHPVRRALTATAGLVT